MLWSLPFTIWRPLRRQPVQMPWWTVWRFRILLDDAQNDSAHDALACRHTGRTNTFCVFRTLGNHVQSRKQVDRWCAYCETVSDSDSDSDKHGTRCRCCCAWIRDNNSCHLDNEPCARMSTHFGKMWLLLLHEVLLDLIKVKINKMRYYSPAQLKQAAKMQDIELTRGVSALDFGLT